jgi:hypothetical protein
MGAERFYLAESAGPFPDWDAELAQRIGGFLDPRGRQHNGGEVVVGHQEPASLGREPAVSQ